PEKPPRATGTAARPTPAVARRRARSWQGELPSPPFRGEREGPAPEAWEGEVGAGRRSGIPHLTPALSAPGDGEGVIMRVTCPPFHSVSTTASSGSQFAQTVAPRSRPSAAVLGRCARK